MGSFLFPADFNQFHGVPEHLQCPLSQKQPPPPQIHLNIPTKIHHSMDFIIGFHNVDNWLQFSRGWVPFLFVPFLLWSTLTRLGFLGVCLKDHHVPVKTCNDLFALKSDAYVITSDHRLELDPEVPVPPFVEIEGHGRLHCCTLCLGMQPIGPWASFAMHQHK